jgi:hypothetical protein
MMAKWETKRTALSALLSLPQVTYRLWQPVVYSFVVMRAQGTHTRHAAFLLRVASSIKQAIPTDPLNVVGRGRGVQVIGDVGLDKCAVARHEHSARARDHVTVVKLTEESFLKAVLQQAQSTGGLDELAAADGGSIITIKVTATVRRPLHAGYLLTGTHVCFLLSLPVSPGQREPLTPAI